MWSPHPERPIGRLADFWHPDGVVLLGGPIEGPCVNAALAAAAHGEWPRPAAMAMGPPAGPFVRGLVTARLRLMEDSARLVTQLLGHAPPDYPARHVALLLLVYCVAPKADHLLRLLPPAVNASFAPQVDRILLETLESIVEARLSARQVEQSQFALTEGGLGLWARSGGMAAAAYVGSWALTYHRVSAATGWTLPLDWADAPTASTAYALFSAVASVRDAGAAQGCYWIRPGGAPR